jgi:thiol-disulfide isomerase/thioredoxin
MILVNDAFMSLNLNEDQELEGEFDNLFGALSKIQKLKLGKYKLVDMLRQFCVTCPNEYSNNSSRTPYINIALQRLSDNPFKMTSNKAILLLMVREYKNKNDFEPMHLDSSKRKNCNSMPLETNETRLNSISYPLYPDNMNHALVIFKELSMDMLVALYFSILCQQKIVIISSKVEKVSLIIESIFKLVYPLDTSIYTTIGFIAEGMMEFACAPIPVIIG